MSTTAATSAPAAVGHCSSSGRHHGGMVGADIKGVMSILWGEIANFMEKTPKLHM